MAGQVPTQKDAIKTLTGHLIMVLEEVSYGELDLDDIPDDNSTATGLGLATRGSGKLSKAEVARLDKAKDLIMDRLGKIGGA